MHPDMKFNFFHAQSPYYPFRWFIIITFVLLSGLVYANLTGMRLLSFNSQKQWNASGPGHHK